MDKYIYPVSDVPPRKRATMAARLEMLSRSAQANDPRIYFSDMQSSSAAAPEVASHKSNETSHDACEALPLPLTEVILPPELDAVIAGSVSDAPPHQEARTREFPKFLYAVSDVPPRKRPTMTLRLMLAATIGIPLPFSRLRTIPRGKLSPRQRNTLLLDVARTRPSAVLLPPSHVAEAMAIISDESENRRCVHCSTTRTPLWRIGPQGKNTLCNACGIRWQRSMSSEDSRRYPNTNRGAHGDFVSDDIVPFTASEYVIAVDTD